MANFISGLTEGSIRSCLDAFRAIAAMQEEEAMRATDEVLAQILGGGEVTGSLRRLTPVRYDVTDDLDDWQVRQGEEHIERLTQSVERLEASLLAPEGLRPWDGEGLRGSVERLDEYMDKTVRQLFAPRIAELKERASQVAKRVEAACCVNDIRGSAAQVIHNAGSVRSIIGSVDKAVAVLSKSGLLTPDLAQVARSAKERAARHRYKKKLDEAEVAAAGGSDKRAAKLRREGAATLAQDWAIAFPGEPPPSSGE